MFVIPATMEAEIRRILAPGQSGKKVYETPSQQKKSMVAYLSSQLQQEA
jgi:hypothetical protein